MLVRDVMQSKLITIDPETTLPQAMRLAAERRVRHLPVVRDGELIGIVSDRDLKQAMASPATSLEAHELNYLLNRLTVGEIMTRAVITIGPMAPFEEAARLMVQEKISALPVMAAGQLIGIVTETDLLDLLVRAMGAGTPLDPARPAARRSALGADRDRDGDRADRRPYREHHDTDHPGRRSRCRRPDRDHRPAAGGGRSGKSRFHRSTDRAPLIAPGSPA